MFIAAGVIIVLICIYLFCIAPNAKKRSYKAPNVGYAHRGLVCSERPENSVAAFAAAVEKGVGIETDVRLTKDGEIYDKETLYWAGYIYRYWNFYTGESSREIYKQAPAKTMKVVYLMYHTMSPEMAIDRLKEAYSTDDKN